MVDVNKESVFAKLDPIPDLGEWEDENQDVDTGEVGETKEPDTTEVSTASTDEVKPEATGDVDLEDLKTKAATFEQMMAAAKKDPVGFVKGIIEQLPEDQKKALLQTPETTETVGELENILETPVEQFVIDNKTYIESIPKLVEITQQGLQLHDRYIDEAYIQLAIAEAKMSAILDSIGAELPDIDRAALDKELSSGKVSYVEAVSKVYKPTLEKSVAHNKQAVKPRPKTPASSSNDTIDIPKNASMVEMYKMLFG